ncbi:MAG TPA: C-terminal binding protein [Caldilineaceae bacterium]|nr:C-terminal binding protein [Caldilineaceae bacterium]
MKPKVLIAYSGFGDLAVEQEVLRRIDAEIIHTGDLTSPQSLAAVKTADALMVALEKVSAEIIASMTRCRVISRAGTGLDSIDIAAATAHGVWVAYVPDYSIDEVSTHAISLLLSLARGVVPLVQATRSGQWNSQLSGPVYRLKGKTLGVAGFGRIGQAAAEKGKGLGLNVLAYDPYLDGAAAARIGVQAVDLETLTRQSDFISLHMPLNEATHQFVNADFLAQMKPTAYLINAARGPLIDEAALLAAQRSGQIAGAGLDVLTVEPPAPDHPLLHEPRILVTPHSAWYSEEAKIDLRTRCAEEVVRVLNGEKPRSPVNQIA